MTVDVRSFPGGVPSAFEFNSQAGILFVLRAIRASAVDSSDKNKLKDLVFLYNTGGKDEGVKKKLAVMLAELKVTPESVLLEKPKDVLTTQSNNPPAGTAGFPTGRPIPVFTTQQPNNVVQIKSQPQPQPTLVDIPKIVVPASAVVSETLVEKVIPVVVQQVIRPVVPIPQKPASINVVSVPVIPANVELQLKPPTPTPTPTVTASVIPSEPVVEKPLDTLALDRIERIRVIKSDVNSRVGNPVNLVDADNAIGREYMTALLEAMKLLSSASEAESHLAMSRLEKVYSQVIALLREREEASLTTSAPQPSNQDTASEVTSPITTALTAVPTIATTEPIVRIVPTVAVEQVSPVVTPTELLVRSKVTDRLPVAPMVNTWSDTEASPGAVDKISSVADVVAPEDVTTVARLSTPPAEPLRAPVDIVSPVYQPEITPAVSTVTPLRSISELPTADEVSAVEAMGSNPLYTKDIDAGLDQLLGEWSIFKKSGMFGSGPKGREHPLYQKISPLQVPLILSGRFEGSTQEIKQSITDYMNGWRYEQGIIYEANETLDQYLRRVIRHIIDLQKTKRRS